MKTWHVLGIGLALLAACGEDDSGGGGGAGTGGSSTGGNATGGSNTGGSNTGGSNTGGSNTGGTGGGVDASAGTGGVDASAGGTGGATTGGAGGTGGGAGVDAGCVQIGTGGTGVQWNNPFGTPKNDRALGVATDASDNVFISGNTSGDLGKPFTGLYSDAYLRKVSPTGGHLWTHQFGSSSTDAAYATVVDVKGKLVVGGVTAGAFGGPYKGKFDGFVRKLADGVSAPTVEWTHQFGSVEDDYVLDLATDQSERIIAVGRTLGSLLSVDGGTSDAGALGGSDALVRVIDKAGTEVWTKQYGTSKNDQAYTVATDVVGGIYIAGYTQGDFFGPNQGGWDAYLAKLDGSGKVLWGKQMGGGGTDFFIDIAVHYVKGEIYAVGQSSKQLGCQPLVGGANYVVKFDASGTILWATQLAATSQVKTIVLGGGGLYAGGRDATKASFVTKLDPATGNVLWTQQLQNTVDLDDVESLAVDLKKNVLAVGFHDKLNDNHAFVAKLSP